MNTMVTKKPKGLGRASKPCSAITDTAH